MKNTVLRKQHTNSSVDGRVAAEGKQRKPSRDKAGEEVRASQVLQGSGAISRR